MDIHLLPILGDGVAQTAPVQHAQAVAAVAGKAPAVAGQAQLHLGLQAVRWIGQNFLAQDLRLPVIPLGEGFKAEIEKRPESLTALLMGRAALDQIGEQLKKPELFVETFDAVIAYCKASENQTLQTLAENLETYSNQRRQMEEQVKAESEAAPEATADAE